MDEPIQQFTVQVPRWSPHLKPVQLTDATPEQQKALEVTPSNKGVSDYVLVLAHDPEALTYRNPLFNEIMYGPGTPGAPGGPRTPRAPPAPPAPDGLSRADRELGAVGASEANRCIYCTAVHASRYISLTDQPDVIDRIFQDEAAAVLPPREQAIFDYAVNLSAIPPQATEAHLHALRTVGLSDLEIVDLTLSAAIFCWANRLMETLGQPVLASETS